MSSSPQDKKLSPSEFASRIKSKYPNTYDDIDDLKLTRRVLSKYPTYNDMVDLPDLDKPIDHSIIEQEATKFGLKISSGKRTPQEQQELIRKWEAGGRKGIRPADNSDHLTDNARDIVGDRKQEFYDYMRDTYGGRMKQILNEGTHIHIAWSPAANIVENAVGAVEQAQANQEAQSTEVNQPQIPKKLSLKRSDNRVEPKLAANINENVTSPDSNTLTTVAPFEPVKGESIAAKLERKLQLKQQKQSTQNNIGPSNVNGVYKPAKVDPFSGKPTVRVGKPVIPVKDTSIQSSPTLKPKYLIPSENIKDEAHLDSVLNELAETRKKFIDQGFPESSYVELDRKIRALSQAKNDLERMKIGGEVSKQAPTEGGRPKDAPGNKLEQLYANAGHAILSVPHSIERMAHGVERVTGITPTEGFEDRLKRQEEELGYMKERGGSSLLSEIERGGLGLLFSAPMLGTGSMSRLATIAALETAGEDEAPKLSHIGKAALINAAMGGVLKAGHTLSIPKRILLGSTTGAGIAAVSGADREQIIAQGILFGGLGLLGGKGERKAEYKVGEEITDKVGNRYKVVNSEGENLELEPIITKPKIEAKGSVKPKLEPKAKAEKVEKAEREIITSESKDNRLELEKERLKREGLEVVEPPEGASVRGEKFQKESKPTGLTPKEDIDVNYGKPKGIPVEEYQPTRKSIDQMKAEMEGNGKPSVAETPKPKLEPKTEPQVEQKVEPKTFEQGLTPEGSGTSHLSNEELARTERFYKVGKGSSVTSLGKQPDASLRDGEAVVAIDPQGRARIVNSSGRIDEAAITRKAQSVLSEQQKLDPSDAANRKATPDLVATVEQTPLRKLSEATGLDARKAEKGRSDIIADGEREFSREALTVKRAVIEGDLSTSSNRPIELDENSIRERVTNNYGGPEGLRSDYTAEGLRKVLNLPDDFQLNPLLDSGLVERTDRGYRFSDDIQGGVKKVSDVREGVEGSLSKPEPSSITESNPQSITTESGAAELRASETSSTRKANVGERTFPNSLEAENLPKGSNLSYGIAHNSESLAHAERVINEKGLEGAITEFKLSQDASPENVTLGQSIIRKLHDRALTATDPAVAQSEMEKAMDVAGDLSSRLTRYGQSIQAANLVSEFAPERAVQIGQRILDKAKPGTKLKPEKAIEISKSAKAIETAEANIRNIDEQINNISKRTSKTSERVGGNVEGGAMEGAAKETTARPKRNRLFSEEQKAKDLEFLKSYWDTRKGSGGPDTEYLTAAARVGAYYLESGARALADWSKMMIDELGEEVRPYLNQLAKDAYETLRKARSENRVQGIKALNAIDEIKELIQDAKNLEREAAKSEKKTLTLKARESAKEAKKFSNQDRTIESKEAREKVKDKREAQAGRETEERSELRYEHKEKEKLRTKAEAAEERQYRESQKQSAEGKKKLERQDKEIEAKEARDKKKLYTKEEARKQREANEQVRREGRDRNRWDYQLRQDSRAANERLNSNSSLDPVGDLSEVGAEKLTKIGSIVDGQTYDLNSWTKEMADAYGDQFSSNKNDTYKGSFEKMKEARDSYSEQIKTKSATGGADPDYLTGEQIQKLMDEKEQHQRASQQARKELAKTYESLDRWGTLGRKIVAISTLPKALKASFDISAPGRQGMIFTFNHPVESAKSFWNQLEALVKNPEAFRNFEKDLYSDPSFRQSQKAGIQYTMSGSHGPHALSLSEDAFISSLSEKIPGVRHSEQAYTTFLNSQRLRMYKLLSKSLEAKGLTFENAPHEYKGLADFINKSTGRGSLGALEKSAPFLNTLGFAPRWIASRFQLMNPLYYAKLPKAARQIAMREMVKYSAGIAGTLWLLNKAGKAGILPNVSVSADPTSGDFGKVVWGNAHYDLTGGFQQEVRFILRELRAMHDVNSGKWVKRQGNWYNTETGRFEPDAVDIAKDFLRRKLAPVPGDVWSLAEGGTLTFGDNPLAHGIRKVAGKPQLKLNQDKPRPFSPMDESLDLVTPLIVDDLWNGYQTDGAKGVAKALPSAVGISTSYYKPKLKPKGH